MPEFNIYESSSVTIADGIFRIDGVPSIRTLTVVDDGIGTVSGGGRTVPDTGAILDGYDTISGAYDSSQDGFLTPGGSGAVPIAVKRAVVLEPPTGGQVIVYEIVAIQTLTDPSGGVTGVVETSLGWIGNDQLSPGTDYTFISEHQVVPTAFALHPNLPAPSYSELIGATCFAAGTLILTTTGWRPVESIGAGDFIVTMDHGPRAVIWAGRQDLSSIDLMAAPRRRPIIVEPGALGVGRPSRQLVLSRQHRVLVDTGTGEGLVAVGLLEGAPGIRVDHSLRPVSYVHLLFDRHEIVFSEGLASESLFPGPVAIDMLGPKAAVEVRALIGPDPAYAPARPFLRRRDLRAAGMPWPPCAPEGATAPSSDHSPSTSSMSYSPGSLP